MADSRQLTDMKIYTRTGDEGETGLLGGARVPKDHPRIRAVGTIDELNAIIGVARCQLGDGPEPVAEIDLILGDIQHQLFDCGAELGAPDGTRRDAPLITEATIVGMERAIDRFEATLPPLREFILPGGCPAAAQLHVARCVCRRAERLLVTFGRTETLRVELMQYLNRLSDLLFVLARAANQAAGMPDVPWRTP
ncbi:MAG: cob(I)yrinic acid a,c-diamide adenosyltransferase [Pirellulales bacterium]